MLTEYIAEKKQFSVEFDSLAELVAGGWDHKTGHRAVAEHDGESYAKQKSWYGCTTKQAEHRVKLGWPEGMQRVLDMPMPPLPQPRSIRRVRHWSDEGDELCMDKVWRGQLEECWQTTRRANRAGIQRVLFYCELGINCGTEPDVLFWRGAAALRMADLLQSAGYNARIIAGASVAHLSAAVERFTMTVPVKEYCDPLNLDTLAAIVANAAFFRREVFRAMDIIPDMPNGFLGSPSATISDAVARDIAMREGAILFKVGERVHNLRTAQEWLTQCATTMTDLFERTAEAA